MAAQGQAEGLQQPPPFSGYSLNNSNTTTPEDIHQATSESQIWQCIEKLAFVMVEMAKREDQPTAWKPASCMTPKPASLGMNPTQFRVWARSVTDYGRLCKWPKDQEALSVRLLCEENIQEAIDARVERREWEALSINEAIDIVWS